MKPTQILAKLCKEAKFDPPVYSDGQIKIGNHIYHTSEFGENGFWGDFEEHAALQVLHRLVHCATRQFRKGHFLEEKFDYLVNQRQQKIFHT